MVALHPPSEFFGIGGLAVAEALFPGALVVGAFVFLDLGERWFGGGVTFSTLILGFGDPGVETGGKVGGSLGIGDGVEALRIFFEVEELRLRPRGSEPLRGKGGNWIDGVRCRS